MDFPDTDMVVRYIVAETDVVKVIRNIFRLLQIVIFSD